MRPVSELYGRYPGSDIYVVGTGASVRVFPLSLLDGKITIGLNMAWKLCPVRYAITIRPELNVPEFMGEGEYPDIQWVTKREKLTTPEQARYVEAHRDRFFNYRTDGKPNTLPPDQPSEAGRVLDWVRRPTGDYLYLWSSISQSAINLAANMGARNIFLIGCDNCSLGGNHHAHNQHTFWKGADPDVRYRQYEEGVVEVRTALRERAVNLLSITPFVSLANPVRDFERLCDELNQPQFIANEDITPSPPIALGGATGGRPLSALPVKVARRLLRAFRRFSRAG